MRAPDLAYATLPNQGGDFIGAKLLPGPMAMCGAFYGKSRVGLDSAPN